MPEDSAPRPALTAEQRRALLAMRPWTPDERRIIIRGFGGRFFIAIEPAVIALLFGLFTQGLVRRASDGNPDHAGLELLAPIFALGAVAFAVYAVVLLLKPLRALRETYQPIFVVDGYLRTRGRDDFSPRGFNGYVAVLLDNRQIACEWPTVGDGDLPSSEACAMLEFSEYGGIHSIDGRRTGVLPENFPNIGVGASKKR